MDNRQNWIEWIKKLPNWIKGAVTYVTFIVVSILYFRENPYLSLSIIFFAILGAAFALGLILAFKKTTPLIEGGKGVHQFQRYRPLGFALIVFTPLILVLAFLIQPTQVYLTIAMYGTPTPTPHPTATSTLTPTPEKPNVTMLVTVEEGRDCYGYMDRDWVQKSILDIAINNNSDRDILLTSVLLKPVGISVDLLAGELEVTEVYSVIVDSWAEGSTAWFDPSTGRSSETLDPIYVEDIPANKYTIKRQSQERFQISLGIGPAEGLGDYLMQGSVILEVETDSGQKLTTDPLEIIVCY